MWSADLKEWKVYFFISDETFLSTMCLKILFMTGIIYCVEGKVDKMSLIWLWISMRKRTFIFLTLIDMSKWTFLFLINWMSRELLESIYINLFSYLSTHQSVYTTKYRYTEDSWRTKQDKKENLINYTSMSNRSRTWHWEEKREAKSC